MNKNETPTPVVSSELVRRLVKLWTDRRTRKLHEAHMAAGRGDYNTALQETHEADATLLCLQDLCTEQPPNVRLTDAGHKTL